MFLFDTGITILIIGTGLFFIVFLYLCYLWSDAPTAEERIIIALAVSFFHSFKIFLIGFFIILFASLIFEYLKTLV